jgi:carbon-monoxide dehydrogenase medium subunit
MSDLRYERPSSLKDAVAVLSAAAGGARLVAGGTDLMVASHHGRMNAQVLVNIKHIPELNALGPTEDGGLEIGAALPVYRLYETPQIVKTYAALAEGAFNIGSVQIRNRATVGGNLCNASACMDTGPGLLVLDAELKIYGPSGYRMLPLKNFFKGYKSFDLAPDEILVSVVLPKPPADLRSGFEKLKRTKGHDLALVNAAASFVPSTGVLKAAVGACSAIPLRLPELNVAGKSVAEVEALFVENALANICPISDVRSCSEYRRDMTALFCQRLVARLLGSGK